jgi:hypothetical protein
MSFTISSSSAIARTALLQPCASTELNAVAFPQLRAKFAKNIEEKTMPVPENIELVKQAAELAGTGASGGVLGFFGSREVFTYDALFWHTLQSAWIGACCLGIYLVYPKAAFVSLLAAAGFFGLLGISTVRAILERKAPK